ncbi:hypothetical protein [Paenibacillus timonensis]|nr:hypothetical protein [Paenibacillus timonensis]
MNLEDKPSREKSVGESPLRSGREEAGFGKRIREDTALASLWRSDGSW